MITLNAISIEAIIDDSPTPSKVDKKPASVNNPLAGFGIKDMFDRIDSKQPSQNTQIGDNRDKVEQMQAMTNVWRISKPLHKNFKTNLIL